MKKNVVGLLLQSTCFLGCNLTQSNSAMPAGKYIFAYEASFVTEEANDDQWVNLRKVKYGGIVFNTDKDSIIENSYADDANIPIWGFKSVKKVVEIKYKNIPRHYLDYTMVGVYEQMTKPVENYHQVLYYSAAAQSLLEVSYHGLIVNAVILYANNANFKNPFNGPKAYFNMLKEEFPPEKIEVDSAFSTGVSN